MFPDDRRYSKEHEWIRVDGANGTVGITNWNSTNWAAIYFPDQGFVGTNKFTFAAWNGRVDSALCTGTVAVVQGPYSISAKPLVPPNYPANWLAPFSIEPSPSNIVGTVTFDWDFADASSHSTNQYATHAYNSPGNYNWKVISQVQSGLNIAKATNTGTIVIEAPVTVTAGRAGNSVLLSWPQSTADALLEQSPTLGPGAVWTVCTNPIVTGGGSLLVTVPNPAGSMYYRLRKL